MISQVSLAFAGITAVCGMVKLRDYCKSSKKKKKFHLTCSIPRGILGHLHDMRMWKKIGKVDQLYIYPFVSILTYRIRVQQYILNFDLRNSSFENLIYENNMFIIYDKDTKYIQTDKKIKFIQMIITSKCTVQLSAPHMPRLHLDIKEIMKKVNPIESVGSFAEKFLVEMEFTDCGGEAAIWLSMYLGKKDLGLGYVIHKPPSQRIFSSSMKELYDSCDDIDDRDIEIPYSLLSECRLQTLSSLQKFYEDTGLCYNNNYDVPFNPNIVISFTQPFEEDEWNWIKIGEVILKNVRPWPRSKTGTPLKHIPVEMRAALLMLYCQVIYSGVVRQDDNIYVYSKVDISDTF